MSNKTLTRSEPVIDTQELHLSHGRSTDPSKTLSVGEGDRVRGLTLLRQTPAEINGNNESRAQRMLSGLFFVFQTYKSKKKVVDQLGVLCEQWGSGLGTLFKQEGIL